MVNVKEREKNKMPKKCNITWSFKDRKKKEVMKDVNIKDARKVVRNVKGWMKKGLYKNVKEVKIKC